MGAVGSEALRCVTAGKIDFGTALFAVCRKGQFAGAAVTTGVRWREKRGIKETKTEILTSISASTDLRYPSR